MAQKKSGKASKALNKKSMKSVKGGAVDMFRPAGQIKGAITDGTSNTITFNQQAKSQDIHF